jgi:hypothetical protein
MINLKFSFNNKTLYANRLKYDISVYLTNHLHKELALEIQSNIFPIYKMISKSEYTITSMSFFDKKLSELEATPIFARYL